MANGDFGSKQELQEYLAGLKQIDAQYRSLNKQAKELANTPGNAREAIKKQLKELREQNDSHKEILDSIKRAQKELDTFSNTQEKITKQAKKSADAFEDMVDSFGELEGLQHSISAQFGKNHVQTKAMEAVVEKTKAQYNGIKSILNNTSDIQQHQKDSIENALEIYKNFPVTVADLNKELKRGKIEQEGVNSAIISTVSEYSDFVNQLDTSNESIALIKQRLEDLLPTMDKFKTAAEASKKEFENIDAAAAGLNFLGGGVAGGSAIISSAAEIRKNMLSGTDLKQMTLVGAVIGAVELQAQLQGTALAAARADNAIEEAFLNAQLEIVETSLALRNFLPNKKALIEFKYELRGLTEEFRAASSTAFFGADLGNVPFNPAQLQLAGIGVSSLKSAVTDLATTANTGIRDLGYQVAVFAESSGIASSEFGTIMGYFRMLDKSKGMDSMVDVQKELRKSAEEGFNPADIAGDLKDAGALALEYNIKSGKELVRQVKSVREMGASWAKISEAGKSMVLNYKDSISKEMELSAMLGENVDLSEIRAKFMMGDTPGALADLKSSGLLEKAQSQGMFAIQALSGALGGMDLQQLAAGEYEKDSFKMPTNQEFLDKLTEAQKNLRIQNARISIENQQEMAGYNAIETMILRGDKTAIEIAGKIIQQDAQNFLKEQAAKLGAGADLFIDQYNFIRDLIPGGNLLPEGGSITQYIAKKAGAYSPSLGTDYNKFPAYSKDKIQKYEYLPGITPISSTEAGIRNLTPGSGQKFSFETANKIQEAQKNQQKIANNSDTQSKSLMVAGKSLQSIDAQNILQTQLLQNIQALTAATSNLANMGMSDIKLLLDGKEVKSRIEKIAIQEKGKMRG